MFNQGIYAAAAGGGGGGTTGLVLNFDTVIGEDTYTEAALDGNTISALFYGAQRLDSSQYNLVGSDLTFTFTPNQVVNVLIIYSEP